MSRKIPLPIKIAVPIVGLLATVAGVVLAVGILKAWWGLPFSPVRVEAVQPIEFPHDVHAQQMGIDCLFCHRTVDTDEAASFPAVQQCMFCHQVVKKDSPEVAKLVYAAENNIPINWVRVHRLPDHVQFVHSAHIKFFSEQNNVAPSQVCGTCHGDVKSMKTDVQVRSLKMGDCVNCHRSGYLDYLNDGARQTVMEAVTNRQMAPPPTDCAACHY